MKISVIVPTHNPHPQRLARTLAGLAAQILPTDKWETILVDNASSPALDTHRLPSPRPSSLRLVCEPRLGLSAARHAGVMASAGEFCVFVDDDNVLSPSYLADVVRIFEAEPELGAIGGPVRAEFASPPPAWLGEFLPLLAVRDLGPEPQTSGLERAPDNRHYLYPAFAPVGAGMAVRRTALDAWLASAAADRLPDRRGTALSSAGDNELVLMLLHAGWKVGYFPELAIDHLIPANRLEPAYLARLNRGIQKSWTHVLSRYRASPWCPIPRWSVPLRQAKAWLTHRGWSHPAGYIRWQGACGHFEGRALERTEG